MDIIRMEGGLGNQLFQYALYRQLQFMGRTVKMDVTTEYGRENDRQQMLWALDAVYETATQNEINRLTDGFMDLPSRIRRKLTGRRTKRYAEADNNFDPQVFQKTPVYLTGYFQSEKYFKNVEEILHRELRFSDRIYDGIPKTLADRIKNYRMQICESESVALHVRRGDYLEHPEMYGVSCTTEYYRAGVHYIRERHPDAKFFVFTNDPVWTEQWIQENFLGDFTLVRGTSEETGYLDLMLMSRCKHQIMANSSFSWWGAWLNPNKDKLVIAPEPWFGDRECRDIYTEGMIRISPDGRIRRKERISEE